MKNKNSATRPVVAESTRERVMVLVNGRKRKMIWRNK